MNETDFNEAVAAYNKAVADYKQRLAAGVLDSGYYKAGRQARRALRHCFCLAAKLKLEWTPGDCRTFY